MNKVIEKLRKNIIFNKVFNILLILLVFLYSFSIPSFGSRDSYSIILYTLLILLTFVTIFGCVLRKKYTFIKQSLLLVGFVFISLLGTIFYLNQYRNWFTIVLLVLSFYIFYYAFSIIDNKQLILFLLSGSIFCFSLYFIYVYRNELLSFKNYANGSFRLGFYFDNPNGVSAFCVIGFVVSLYCLLFIKKKYRWFFILPIFTTVLVGISTGSRTFIVAMIFMSLVLFFLKFKKYPLIFGFCLGVLILILLIIFSMPFMSSMRERFLRIFWTLFTDSSRVDTSFISRSIWIDYGLYLGNKHLLTGLGPGGFSFFSGVGTYTHSNISEVWCDFGLIGFVLFYLPLPLCLYRCLKNKNRNSSLVFCILVYYFLISFSNVFYYTKFYYFILAFVFYLTFNEKAKKNLNHINSLDKNCKHILFTCDGMGSGGAEKTISQLSNSFAKKGFKVTIIGVSAFDKKPFYELENGVDYDTLNIGKCKHRRIFRKMFMLRKKIKFFKPDLIVSFLPHINVYTYFATIGLDIPVIVSERNNPKRDPKNKVLRFLKKTAFAHADGIVFQTNGARLCYRKSIRNRGKVIPNPIDSNLLKIKQSNSKNKVILSVGRLVKQKNFKCLINAFSLFVKKHPDYILRIYGEGPLREELMKYAYSIGIYNNFQIMDNDPYWQKKEKDDAMFVLSSDYEGMPNVLLEAMVIGLPCISTDCPSGGPSELIKNGKNGFLVEVGDVITLANKMEELLIHKFDFDIDEYRQKFLIDNISGEWLDYFNQVFEVKMSL